MPRPELVFLAGQRLPRCDHRVDKHFTAYQTLQFMDSGEVSLSVGGKPYALRGRWAWSGFSGPRVAFGPAAAGRTWSHRYVAFRGPLVRRWARDGLFPVPPRPVPAGDFAGRFDAVLARLGDAGPAAAARTALLLEGLLLELSLPAAGPTWVDRAKAELRGADATPDYEQLAGDLGLSVRGLRRHFRARVGQSPHQYAIGRRIDTARGLLLGTDLPVKEVARRLGYADVFYFGRQFKKQTGVPPGLFRKSREG